MAGRPKLNEEVATMTLRLSPALLVRVNRCKALIELEEGTNLSRTQVLWRIIDVGCQVLEGQTGAPHQIVIPQNIEIPESPQTPDEHAATTAMPTFKLTAAPPGTRTVPEHIVRIAEERAKFQYSRLSLREFARHLYDAGIYRSTTKDGQAVAVHPGTLKKWLDHAGEAGLL